MTALSSHTRIIGIFGYPLGHTLSPAMQNAAFAARRLDLAYCAFPVPPAGLGAAVAAIRALGLAGVNITIPHKETVLRFLDRVDPLAKKIGSVNTIVNNGGTLTGYNTDAPGFIDDLRAHRADPKGKQVLLVGTGGAGRAIAYALTEAGARLLLTDRDERRARRLARKLPRAAFVPFASWKHALADAALLVNATPVGMQPGAPLATARELPHDIFVYDIVYNRRTELLKEARRAGVRGASGSGMLLFQGARAYSLWTKQPAPVAVMRRALERQLRTVVR